MNALKCRAWDEEEGMFIPEYVNNTGGYAVGSKNGKTLISSEIMYETGVKDKNGNMIYQGDILSSDCEIIGNVFENRNLLHKERG